jgi:Fe-S cluster assembly protein SufD
MSERTVKRVVRSGRSSAAKTFTFNHQDGPELDEYRRVAWQAYESLPIPNTRMEPWRRTDLRRLATGDFQVPERDAYLDLAPIPEDLLSPLVGESHGGQIVMLPGHISSQVNAELQEQGVVFSTYEDALANHADLVDKIRGKTVAPDAGKFAAMTGALSKAGVLLYVPRNVQVEQPLHSVLWAAGTGLAHFAHLMIYLEEGASVTFVHESASPSESGGQTLTGLNVEMIVGANARLRFVELQSLGDHVWNFTHEQVHVERDGDVDWIFGAVGTHVTKNFSDVSLNGQGANGRMSGFYFTDGHQHLDHDTQQNHNAANTTSDLLFKGALRDESRSVWQGMIYVAPGAQKTDGYQANRNLVLDTTARADSIPGLEILADDVRCTHGATVGNIDPELVFYLKSRGVSQRDAERIVVQGFFDPIMQRIPFEGVRERFQDAILTKMG